MDNLWEKIRKDIQEGATTVSEKTSELFKSGAEVVKDGAETASTRINYSTRLAQLNWEHRTIQKNIEEEYEKLGALFFELNEKKKLDDFKTVAKPQFDLISTLEKELAETEKQQEELPEVYGLAGIDKSTVSDLKKNLEESGGTIMQVVIEKGSSFLGKQLKDVKLPKEALMGTILRQGSIIIPDGQTEFLEGDKVTILGKKEDVELAIQQMLPKKK